MHTTQCLLEDPNDMLDQRQLSAMAQDCCSRRKLVAAYSAAEHNDDDSAALSTALYVENAKEANPEFVILQAWTNTTARHSFSTAEQMARSLIEATLKKFPEANVIGSYA